MREFYKTKNKKAAYVELPKDECGVYSVADSLFTEYLDRFNTMMELALIQPLTEYNVKVLSEEDKLHMSQSEIQEREKQIVTLQKEAILSHDTEQKNKHNLAKAQFKALQQDQEFPLFSKYFLYRYRYFRRMPQVKNNIYIYNNYVDLPTSKNYLPKGKELQHLFKLYGPHPLLLAILGFYYRNKSEKIIHRVSYDDILYISKKRKSEKWWMKSDLLLRLARLNVKEIMGVFVEDVSQYIDIMKILAPSYVPWNINIWNSNIGQSASHYIQNGAIDNFAKEYQLPDSFKQTIISNLKATIELKTRQLEELKNQTAQTASAQANNNNNTNTSVPSQEAVLNKASQVNIAEEMSDVIEETSLTSVVTAMNLFPPSNSTTESNIAIDKTDEVKKLLDKITKLQLLKEYIDQELLDKQSELDNLQAKCRQNFK